MADIESYVEQVRTGLAPVFAEELRRRLETKDREWLIDQLVRLSLDPGSRRALDRSRRGAAGEEARAARTARLRSLDLDEAALDRFLAEHERLDRDAHVANGHLSRTAPVPGTDLIGPEHRTGTGEALLTLAKDLLFALLFGDEDSDTRLPRVTRELLTFTLPAHKAHALDFMQAATEIDVLGSWQDPESVSNDSRAANVVIEVEYGETATELIGRGIAAALSLINDLEVNEQILYSRTEDIEDSSLT